MIFIRSLIFNILFFGWSALICIGMLPFIYMGKKGAVTVTRTYLAFIYFLEKNILNIDYEVRGREFIPAEGSYLVAAKHQSAYETLKLYALFGDPAIILKKELADIPLWGRFLVNLDNIAIDRSNREESMNSIVSESLRIKQQGRPIVIFPQGTRVGVGIGTDKKPYKSGVAKMYRAADIPIVPMALNSGLFWGRNSFMKYPGKVIFQFLPPIAPGQDEKEVLTDITERVEEATDRLVEEGREKFPHLPR
jgi:1-acyl-sn-glycerol-3-phosphate acyltransferase